MAARSPSAGPVLSRRQLNRATLARQLLLERVAMPALSAVEHLAGLQAQVPQVPYVALWCRLRDFRPQELSGALQDRAAVRAALQRATIHLVSARDYLGLRPLLQPVLARVFAGTSFAKRLAGQDVDAVLAAGRALLAERPLGRAELGRLLAERWPGLDAEPLGMAVTYLVPLVQPTPRGLWGRGGQARWAPAGSWLGREPAAAMPPEELIVRYLAAHGPASVADVQAWSGLTRLREVAERMGGRLLAFLAPGAAHDVRFDAG